MIDWLDVRSGQKVTQDIRVTLSKHGDAVVIAFKRGAWVTKLHRSERVGIGFTSNNGVPTAMWFIPSSSGYAVVGRDGKTPSVSIRIQAIKISSKYPRLKLSEIQGDYILREDQNEKACYISLGAKSY